MQVVLNEKRQLVMDATSHVDRMVLKQISDAIEAHNLDLGFQAISFGSMLCCGKGFEQVTLTLTNPPRIEI